MNNLENKSVPQEVVKLSKRQEKEKRELEEAEYRKARAIRSLQYLLTKSMKYSNFFKQKLDKLGSDGNENSPTNRSRNLHIKNDDKAAAAVTEFDNGLKQKYFEGGKLKSYQVEGVIWLKMLFENGVSGILADEMGLGKTVQIIALLCHMYEMNIQGPHLIVVPLSTISNWMSEFKRFAPQIPVVLFYGNQEERSGLVQSIRRQGYYLENKSVKPVIITTYQMPMLEHNFFSGRSWEYLIIDEGHRIKNQNSKLGIELRALKVRNKLLLTGTPLQNNLNELWSLLNFILPTIFVDMETFTSLCLLEQMDNDKIKEDSTSIISTIHKVLSPFVLRRLKCDVLLNLVPKKEVLVYCPLAKLQMDLYKFVLEKNTNQLLGNEEDDNPIINVKRKRICTNYKEVSSSLSEKAIDMLVDEREKNIAASLNVGPQPRTFLRRLTMQSPMVMLKKIVNHPYLVHFPLDPESEEKQLLINENIVNESGKMLVLDTMLKSLKQRGHKVLIFSTMTMILDFIEEFVIMREYNYRRLDGSHKLSTRDESITAFNNNPDVFLFLISTRAGGLGLNLIGADTVILYDRDWNPQVDIQAQDRCHRIGQMKPVIVYSLITKNTIDEKILNVSNMKKRLDKVVIKDGKFKSLKKDKDDLDLNFEELKTLLESSDCQQKVDTNGCVLSESELNKLLDRSDLYKMMEKK